MSKTVGDRIKQARLELKLSGDDLAKRAGYKNQSAIGNLENRATGRGGNKLGTIAAVLDVSVDWLLNGPDTDVIPFLGNRPSQHITWPTHIEKSAREAHGEATQGVGDAVTEAIELIRSMSPAGQQQALAYLRYMASQHSPPILSADWESHSVPTQRRA